MVLELQCPAIVSWYLQPFLWGLGPAALQFKWECPHPSFAWMCVLV